MKIGGFVKTSTLDYPGEIAGVIFTKGCNFHCKHCHNSHLISTEPEETELDLRSCLEYLKKKSHLIDGVVFSGGEPCICDDLFDNISKVKNIGLKVKLDTNGSRPYVVKELINSKIIDYVALDYKLPWKRYEELSKEPVDKMIKETLNILTKSTIEWELRTTLVPELTIDDCFAMLNDIPVVKKYYLQNCRDSTGRIIKSEIIKEDKVCNQILRIQPNTSFERMI